MEPIAHAAEQQIALATTGAQRFDDKPCDKFVHGKFLPNCVKNAKKSSDKAHSLG
jgi:hypothetical protein